MLNSEIFKTIVDSTPLISIDLIVKNNNMILLGRRINKPAQSYFFTVGGRVYKNESIQQAIERIAKVELNIKSHLMPNFIGVFEHFYDNSIYDNVSTHYVNLAYEVNIDDDICNLPTFQHDKYKWFSVDELLKSLQVHKYTKNYFRS